MSESVSSRPEDGGPLRIWDVDRLWHLDRELPVTMRAISSFDDLDRVGWHGQPANVGHLTCREVAEHAQRIYDADVLKPVMLSAKGHLLDGFHRLARAYLLGMNEIATVQFTQDPEPDRIRPLPEWLRAPE